jgi:hypothetical protein
MPSSLLGKNYWSIGPPDVAEPLDFVVNWVVDDLTLAAYC